MNRQQHRLEAILIAKQKLGQNPIYLDAETTGVSEVDEIIELAIIDHDGSVLVDSYVKPSGKVSPDAYAVHGISEEMIKDSPMWVDLWPEVQKVMDGRVLGIYNADFDIRLMEQSHKIAGMSWTPPFSGHFCIMKLYAQFYGEWNPSARDYRWQKLDAARGQANLTTPNSHRAKDDTLLARELLLYMASQTS